MNQPALEFLTRDNAGLVKVVTLLLETNERFAEVFDEMAIALAAIDRASASNLVRQIETTELETAAEERRVELLDIIIQSERPS